MPEDSGDSVAIMGTEEDQLAKATEFLSRIDKQYTEWNNKQSLAEWEYASNLTSENLAKKLNVSAEAARVYKSIWQEVRDYPWKSIKNENIKRQFSKLSVLGVAALPEDVIY